ncbi:MAG TPA: T9SS type A sorting domain-containing protein [Chryseosolibacter sp.]|nr:T9SS type A sorting domain-containing protein [Chryseosolibacter sp.]
MKQLAILLLACSCFGALAQPNITAIEYFFDTDPGFDSGTPVTAFTPASSIQDLSFTADISALPDGFHTLYVRCQDMNTMWSAAYSRPFYKLNSSAIAPAVNITKVEYYVDSDPGFGLGTDVPVTPALNIAGHSFAIALTSVATGFHVLYIRTQDANGTWSASYSRPFYRLDASGIAAAPNITTVEYFIDADPGMGLGTDVPITPGQTISDHIFTIPLESVSDGFHTLYLRAQDANGEWSTAYSRPFYRLGSSALAPAPEIQQVEIFIDADPGFGQGINVPITAAVNIDNFEFTVPLDTVTTGFHTLNIRTRNADSDWSAAYSRPFYKLADNTVTEAPEIVKVEYFFDADPGYGNGYPFTFTGITELVDEILAVDLNNTNTGVHSLNFRVQDANGNWSLVHSTEIDACVQAIPLALDATDIGPGTMTANWVDTVASTFFKLYVSKDAFSSHIDGYDGKPVTATSDVVNGLAGGTYEYRVRAVGEQCESALSNIIAALLPFVQVSAADSLALIAFYNSLNGDAWTNNSNWTTAYVEDWHGVTVDNFKVTALELPSNNLEGDVPEEITSLPDLQTLNLSSNNIQSIPALTTMTALSSVNVSDNSLEFGSLEPNMSLESFLYDDQEQLGTAETLEVQAGTSPSLNVATSGSANTYQWYFNGEPIAQATASAYVIPAASRASFGDYHCEVTNALVPGLTLTSRPSTIFVVADISGKLYGLAATPASEGTLHLLRITEANGYDTIQTFQINSDETGSYTFSNVVLDDYQVVGIADKTLFPKALPTWFNNKLYWEEADVIALEENAENIDITSYQEPDDARTGSGLIDGYVVEDDGTGDGGRVKAKKRVSGAGASVRRVEGSGRGQEELTLVAYVLTNDEGEFEFPNLEEGTYVLNIQYPGYPMDDQSDLNITIGNALESQKRVEAAVEEGKVVVRNLIVTGVWGEDYQVAVFPNPASELVKLRFTGKSASRTLVMYDTRGMAIKRLDVSLNETTIDISQLPTGIYLLDVTEDGMKKKTLRLEIR